MHQGLDAMKIGKIFKKNEEEMKPKVKFEVINGGLSADPQTAGKEPPDDNWLSPMGINTVFLARTKKVFEATLAEFTVIEHSDKAVRLRIAGSEQTIWFDPGRFCASQELFDILHYGAEVDY